MLPVTEDNEIGAFTLPWSGKVNVIAGDQSGDCPVLQNLQPGSKTQQNAGTDIFAGLGIKIIRSPCRMVQIQSVKHLRNILFTVSDERPIYFRQILLIFRSGFTH